MTGTISRLPPARTITSFIDALVIAFAIWTIVCHVTVFSGGSLEDLLRRSGASFLVLAIVAFWLRRRKAKMDGESSQAPTAETSSSDEPFRAGRIGKGYRLGRRSWEYVLWGLCAACLAITFLAKKPEFDDGGNLHISVVAADEPEARLFGPAFLVGLSSLPPAFQIYKVQSFELLEGALSFLTNLPVLDIAHILVPCLTALLVPLVLARLYRLIIPGRWIWGVAVTVFLLFVMGDTLQSYGNFAFIRLQQGKAILLTVGVPLLMFYGLSFALRPTWGRWGMLAAAQIACVGLSSPALWIAPTVVALSVICGLDRFHRPLRTLFAGLSSSVYLVVLAGGMWLQLHGTVDSSTTMSGTELMRDALEKVLGGGPIRVVALLAVLGGWALVKTPMERRVAIVFPLAFFLAWNPIGAKFLAENVTHPLVYWRVFWILPLPMLLAFVSTAPIEAEWFRAPSPVRVAATLCVTAGIFYGVTELTTLSAENRVHWGAPYWKVLDEEFAAACAIAERAPADAWVLAPNDVTTWITTLHQAPRPLVIRQHLTLMLQDQLGVDEAESRLLLGSIVSGWIRPDGAQRLSEAIEKYDLAAIGLVHEVVAVPEVRRVLQDASMSQVASSPQFEIWSTSKGRRGFLGARGCREYLLEFGMD